MRPLRIRLPFNRIRWIRHTNPQLFEPALQSGNFLIHYESGIVWTLNPSIFLSLDITRSSPVLHREYSRWLPSAMFLFFSFFLLISSLTTCMPLNPRGSEELFVILIEVKFHLWNRESPSFTVYCGVEYEIDWSNRHAIVLQPSNARWERIDLQ